MHVLFIHKNFPAQFGHIAAHLIETLDWRCSFVSERDAGIESGVEKIQYICRGGATKHNSYYTRTFETAMAHAESVFRAVKARPDIKPDLVVAHSGFGSSLFLREILDCPIINFFEYFYHPHGSDLDFRPEVDVPEKKFLRSRARNAMIMLDLNNCDVGYSPTRFQRSLFPEEYKPKVHQIFDGVDTKVYHRREDAPRQFRDIKIDPDTRIVTYCARGFERMRGFDIFMKSAKIIYQRYPNVKFLIVGTDRVCYGDDTEHFEEASLRHHMLAQDEYDMSKFEFLGWLEPDELATLMSIGDAHIYLTVPFVLSWSMMNALACGAVVVGSDTAPVQEMITDGETGILANFFDPQEIATKTIEVLKDPAAYQPMRENAMKMINDKYSLNAVLPQMLDLYQSVIDGTVKPAT